MKHLHYIVALPLFLLLPACYGTDSRTTAPVAEHPPAGQAKTPAANIIQDNNWTIVSRMENGDRVYWFLAPAVDNVTPAMFRKTVFGKDKTRQGFETVSQCDAPKPLCDELMQQFKTLSEKYN